MTWWFSLTTEKYITITILNISGSNGASMSAERLTDDDLSLFPFSFIWKILNYAFFVSFLGRKLALLVVGLTSMLLYNYYTSSVVSWLLNAAAPTLNSLDGLIKSDFELIFEDIGYTRGWLAVSYLRCAIRKMCGVGSPPFHPWMDGTHLLSFSKFNICVKLLRALR